MIFTSKLVIFAISGLALAQQPASGTPPSFPTIDPSLAEIEKAASTAAVYDFGHHRVVKGKAFDRFYNVWLENTDYDKAEGQSDLKELAKQGIKLTNYHAVTHPSEPNYLAAFAGDYFGMKDDEYYQVAENVSSVADLLDSKGISWGGYQERLPYAGFQGFNFSNQETFANDYVRKHNPLVLMDNIATDSVKLSKIKNFTEFDRDVANNRLPQWAFITPNMTNDGHDTTIKVAGHWSKTFLDPLLRNKQFTKGTLIVLTFDENETYELQENRVLAVLLGDIPDHLKGTTDDTFYNHYSLISSVQANWELPNLGRNDCGANVFNIINDKLGPHHKWHNKHVEPGQSYNASVAGYLGDDTLQIPHQISNVEVWAGQSSMRLRKPGPVPNHLTLLTLLTATLRPRFVTYVY